MAGNPQIIVEFVADMAKLASGAKDVEKTGQAASKALDWKGVAKFAGAAGGLAAAGGILVKAAKDTATLAKATMALQRATGLDTKTASEWVLLLNQRGIETDTFAKAMLTLSKNMEAWRKAGAGADSPLKALGVSFADVQKGDIGAVLGQVSDGLSKISNPAQKAATTAKLFGKAGAQLAPIIGKGSDAMNASLDATNKYGAALSGSTLKAVQDQTKAQRELKDMQDGLATTIGTSVIPVQAEMFGLLVKIAGPVTDLLNKYGLMTPVVLALAAAYGTYKAAQVAASVWGAKDLAITIAQTVWKPVQAAATALATAAQWAYNAAMIAGLGPMLLVVAAIAAVIAVAILLWKNWDTVSAALSKAFDKIKAAAKAVFDWIKANWPLLLAILTGPIGLAVLAIQRNWSTITDAFSKGVSAAKSALGSLRDFINTAKAKITGYLDDITSAMHEPGAAAEAAVAAAKAAFNSLIKWLKDKASDVGSAAGKVASAMKSPINAVISSWNGISFTIPGFSIGGQKVLGLSVPKVSVPPHRIDFPDIGHLAKGGVLERPTLFIGGEAGREIVTPEKLLRDLLQEHHGGDQFTLVLQPRTADAADVAYGFRRLELLRTGR